MTDQDRKMIEALIVVGEHTKRTLMKRLSRIAPDDLTRDQADRIRALYFERQDYRAVLHQNSSN